jgi:hypothetical protein
MNKCQQMRWSRHGADLLLQVRAAVLNGQFDTLTQAQPVMTAANDCDRVLLLLAA